MAMHTILRYVPRARRRELDAAWARATVRPRTALGVVPEVTIGLALRNIAPKSRSIGERYIEITENTDL
jgi:hypothetical protein